jgi:hypothetical protein
MKIPTEEIFALGFLRALQVLFLDIYDMEQLDSYSWTGLILGQLG